jgi:Flp pilus assembly protein TadG
VRYGPLVLLALLVAATAGLARALVTRDGVGALEYAVGAVLLALLLVGIASTSRRALRRT